MNTFNKIYNFIIDYLVPVLVMGGLSFPFVIFIIWLLTSYQW